MSNILVLRLLILILIFSVCSFAQSEAANDEESFEKGTEIIKLARQAIYRQTPINEVKSLSIQLKRKIHKFSTTVTEKNEKDEVYNVEEESFSEQENIFSLEEPLKVRMYKLLRSSIDSGNKELSIFNGNRIYTKREELYKGDYIDYDLYRKKMNFSYYDYKQDITGESFSNALWEDVFPLILLNQLDDSRKFKYVGKAESPTGKADIVSLIREKAPSGWETKLFFDENTHLLLMMTTSFGSKENIIRSQKRYFYSNNTLIDGILVPQMIKTEEHEFIKQKSYSSKNKIFEEISVTAFKVNPKFSEKEFEIKGDKATEDKKSKNNKN